MKELKIFAIVVILSGILYWGIEPYAHTKLHPHTANAEYNFSKEDTDYAKHFLEQKKRRLRLQKLVATKLASMQLQKMLRRHKKFLMTIQLFGLI